MYLIILLIKERCLVIITIKNISVVKYVSLMMYYISQLYIQLLLFPCEISEICIPYIHSGKVSKNVPRESAVIKYLSLNIELNIELNL